MNRTQVFFGIALFLNLLLTFLAVIFGVYKNEQLFIIEMTDTFTISIVLLYMIIQKKNE